MIGSKILIFVILIGFLVIMVAYPNRFVYLSSEEKNIYEILNKIREEERKKEKENIINIPLIPSLRNSIRIKNESSSLLSSPPEELPSMKKEKLSPNPPRGEIFFMFFFPSEWEPHPDLKKEYIEKAFKNNEDNLKILKDAEEIGFGEGIINLGEKQQGFLILMLSKR